MEKPYVLSAELDLADSDTIILPRQLETFREELDSDLRQLGKATCWVDSRTIQNGLATLIDRTNIPVVSLDDQYVTTAQARLGISRGVDTTLTDVGYVPRAGYGSVAEQLDSIPSLGSEVVIADDVLFSGEMMAWVARELDARGVRIGAVVCGIAIREGIEKLAALGIDTAAVQTFDEVDDEICERDFAVTPGSGRRIAELNTNALYFEPTYGKPAEWASIPSNEAAEFAVRNYKRAARLLRPDITLDQVGRFYGLGQGNARNVLTQAASRIERNLS